MISPRSSNTVVKQVTQNIHDRAQGEESKEYDSTQRYRQHNSSLAFNQILGASTKNAHDAPSLGKENSNYTMKIIEDHH